MDAIVINQSKIRIAQELVAKGAPPFPRPLAWWQRTVPVWVDAAEAEDGRIVLTPNGKFADGRQEELTRVGVRRDLKAIKRYLDRHYALDFSDAIENA
ncbi:hypothetical protein [Streptomyces sp. MZ04]|uniref:hypothetical protein n=1 Tax=Streptomyces sp. MZ04 TaxID=2559236 RepID=UPI00107E964D|nr:hypothetical protein [Streptomyces sp. MZ04]TGB13881.1 hypothetical protein E2651_08045 [Streptomyces sp. MZ04]